MRYRFTIIFIAACAINAPSIGQFDSKNNVTTGISACTSAQALINTDLFGAWTLELQGAAGQSASVHAFSMQRNPEFAESLAGHFVQNGVRHEVFGDIEEGALDMEETNNGKDIRALWKGRVAEGSCGRAITGTRRLLDSQTEQTFILRRAGW